MQYQQNTRQITTTNKDRERNIKWFNPPCSANVVTKVRKHFLFLLDKYFPPHKNAHKIFNRNTISYNCMSNMKTIINSHNQKNTNPKIINKEITYNCVNKAKYLLSKNFLKQHHLQSSININQPTLQRKNLLWHSWNYIQAAILQPPKII